MPNFLNKLLPATWAGKTMLAGIVVWFANWILSTEQGVFGSTLLKGLLDVLSFLALLPLAYWLYRAGAWATERLLWRLRRRLVVTYLLMGLLPLLMLIMLVGLIGYVIVLQNSTNLVQKQLASRLAEAQAISQSLTEELNQTAPAAVPARLAELQKAWQPLFPALELHAIKAGETVPPWMNSADSYHGWVMQTTSSGKRDVFGFHCVKLKHREIPWLHLRYGVEGLSEHLSRATGLGVRAGHASLELTRNSKGEAQLTTVETGHSSDGLPIFVPMREWQTGRVIEGEALHIDPGFLLPTNIWQGFKRFRYESVIGNVLVWTIGGIGVIFAVITALAVVAAVALTHSVTSAVYYLYEGTRRIEAGDLQSEIRVVGKDQLSELGHSFNRMIRSLRELLRVSAEKQRLDQEMKIAAQVQARLFPRTMPDAATLDLAPGICLPARVVSGDYFDYFEIAPGVIGFVIADVCGKGVSAALLMSNLQAHLHSQALNTSALPHDLCALVGHVNRQIADASPESSYATMFYAEYEEASSTLRFVNAGHNPPLLLQGDEVQRLDDGGTVVGLFRDSVYEQGSVTLAAGDLFVAYTDGFLEARNPKDEELGEERLLAWLRERATDSAEAIKQHLLDRVADWTKQAEQEDDLTLLIWRKR